MRNRRIYNFLDKFLYDEISMLLIQHSSREVSEKAVSGVLFSDLLHHFLRRRLYYEQNKRKQTTAGHDPGKDNTETDSGKESG